MVPTRMMKVTNIHAYVGPRKLDYATNSLIMDYAAWLHTRTIGQDPTLKMIRHLIQAMIAKDFITEIFCMVEWLKTQHLVDD